MAVAEVPEDKRFCPACGAEVGRSRDGVPGRTEGFCPKCGTPLRLHAQAARPATWSAASTRWSAASRTAASAGSTWPRDRNVSDRWVVLKGLLNSGDPDALRGRDRRAAVPRRGAAPADRRDLQLRRCTRAPATPSWSTSAASRSSRSSRTADDANDGVNDPLPVDQAHRVRRSRSCPRSPTCTTSGLLLLRLQARQRDPAGRRGQAHRPRRRAPGRRPGLARSTAPSATRRPRSPRSGRRWPRDIYTIGRTLAVAGARVPRQPDAPTSTRCRRRRTRRCSRRYDSFYRLLAKAVRARPGRPVPDASTSCASSCSACCARSSPPTAAGQPARALGGVGAVRGADASTGAALSWDQLPALKVDPTDPSASWLAGVTSTTRCSGCAALERRAGETGRGAARRRAHTAIEAGQSARARRPTIAQILDRRPVGVARRLAGRAAAAGAAATRSRRAPSFNAVYGQVPGRAGAQAGAGRSPASVSGEPRHRRVALRRSAPAPTPTTPPPAAFGLARIRAGARRHRPVRSPPSTW